MREEAEAWFARRTSTAHDWSVDRLVEEKSRLGSSVSVIIPARDEEHTIAGIVRTILTALVEAVPLVDEVIVLDSDSTDRTALLAAQAGATVHAARDIRPDLGTCPGKGEAIWKSQFVSRGDLLVFVDGDVTNFTPQFVTGILGPLFAHPDVALVKGFYDRDLGVADATGRPQGGRVTELTARPLINLWWPELAGVVQPLAGEWACRRDLLEGLALPTGYGVEMATLIDTCRTRGLDAIAQVDLGSRDHRHQDLVSLGAMAAEVIAAAARRRYDDLPLEPVEIAHLTLVGEPPLRSWESLGVSVSERPPAASCRDAGVPVSDGVGGSR